MKMSSRKDDQPHLSMTVNEQLEASFVIESEGFYQMRFQLPKLAQPTRASVYINDLAFGWLRFGPSDEGTWQDGFTLFLSANSYHLQLKSYDAAFRINQIELHTTERPELPKPSFQLAHPHASAEAKAVMHYLSTIYGQRMLTGQHTNSANAPEIDHIYRVTRKRPALCGFDLLSYSHATNTEEATPDAITEIEGNRGSIEKAMEWYLIHGGIVTLCWHWFAPTGGKDKTFYTKQTHFDLERALSPDSEEYAALMRDLDEIGCQLTRLRDAKVPVLWRPLHEADGGWFWWGAKGPEAYKKLYRLMYDRYTNDFKLDNLIWVWNAPHPDWYPGDDVVDLIGDDIYEPGGNHGPLNSAYQHAVALTNGSKPVALTENGPIPDPDLLMEQAAAWLWYMPWWGGFCEDESITSQTMLRKIYDHPYTVTLEELPDWSTYANKHDL